MSIKLTISVLSRFEAQQNWIYSRKGARVPLAENILRQYCRKEDSSLCWLCYFTQNQKKLAYNLHIGQRHCFLNNNGGWTGNVEVLLLAVHIYTTLQTQAKLLCIVYNMLMCNVTMADSCKCVYEIRNTLAEKLPMPFYIDLALLLPLCRLKGRTTMPPYSVLSLLYRRWGGITA